jgi:hypothetical protein
MCMISASNYDQSCNVDSDCLEVSAGDYCSAATCRCGGSAINVGAGAQFSADVYQNAARIGRSDGYPLRLRNLLRPLLPTRSVSGWSRRLLFARRHPP